MRRSERKFKRLYFPTPQQKIKRNDVSKLYLLSNKINNNLKNFRFKPFLYFTIF